MFFTCKISFHLSNNRNFELEASDRRVKSSSNPCEDFVKEDRIWEKIGGREHLETLTSLSATVHGRCPEGARSMTNFVPAKIGIKYFLPLDTFEESSGIP